MPRLFSCAHPRHRQHQAIFTPGALTSWRLGLGIAGPASHFPMAGKQKGLGFGTWATNRNRFPKRPKPNPLALAITQFNTLRRCPQAQR